MDWKKELKDLKQMLDDGILSKEEFEAEKAKMAGMVSKTGINMKYVSVVVAALVVLSGCNGQQKSIVTAQNRDSNSIKQSNLTTPNRGSNSIE